MHFRTKSCQNSLENLCGSHHPLLTSLGCHAAGGGVPQGALQPLFLQLECVPGWAVKTRTKQIMNKRSWGWSLLCRACSLQPVLCQPWAWDGALVGMAPWRSYAACVGAGRGPHTMLQKCNCTALDQSQFMSCWVKGGAELAHVLLWQVGESRAICRVLKQPQH